MCECYIFLKQKCYNQQMNVDQVFFFEG